EKTVLLTYAKNGDWIFSKNYLIIRIYTMSSFMQDSRLSSIIARIPVFTNAIDIAPVAGGLTNVNYRVDTPTETYFLRVGDTVGGLLGIDRENERINTDRAH